MTLITTHDFLERNVMSSDIKQTPKPETMIEVCNAINTAVAMGKTVTVDYPGTAHTTQIAGAFPNSYGIGCILHLNWPSFEAGNLPTTWLRKGGIVRAYRPQETTVEILYTYPSD